MFFEDLLKEHQSADYEDLFDHCRSLEEGTIDNALKRRAVELGKRIKDGPIEEDMQPHYFGMEACRLVQWVVYNALFPHEPPKGFGLLRDTIRSTRYQVEIATLNHDLLVECVLHDADVTFVDGFGITDGDGKRFDGALFEKAKTEVPLYKLHGSIDWYLDGDGAPVYVKLPPQGSIWAHKRGDGRPYVAIDSQPIFLSGKLAKVSSYATQPFAEIHRQFKTALRQTDRIVVSGYGFRDDAINEMLTSWIQESSTRRLVLLYQKLPRQIREVFPEDLQPRVRQHPEWFSRTSAEALGYLLE